MKIGLNIVILFVLVVGFILLQIFLSRRDARWPGLILPGITFLYSLVALLSMAAGGAAGGAMGVAEQLARLAVVFFLCNIPTFLLLGIYFACREKFRRRAQMDKMNIQDLE